MLLLGRVLAGVTALGCLTVLISYGSHVAAPVHLRSGLQGMSPVTSLGLLCAALGNLGENFRIRRLAQAGGAAASAIGIVMLALQAFRGTDDLSPWVATHVFGFDPAQAGLTSVATAGCLLLLGLANLNRGRVVLADGAAAGVLVISGMALLGYAYGVGDLYAIPIFKTMAVHTAAGLFALAFSSILARPEVGWASVVASGGTGGGATRRQLAFTLLPPFGGWILLQATDAHRLGPAAAMALLVILVVVPLALLIIRDGQTLNALDAERRTKAMMQDGLQQDLQARLAAQAEALQIEGAERAKAEAALNRAQRMEAVGQLTGGIAHDFNNLLMAVGGNLQLLTKRLAQDHPGRRYAENATAAIAKGAKLTAQLLAFSRTQRLEARPVELDPVLANARNLIGNALGPMINVHMHLEAGGAWARTDSDQLELAVLNLALNARDAMPEGGDLTVASSVCRARLSGEGEDGDYLSVRVSDTGQGMADEVIEKSVEPFFTTKERGKGTGLGLAQVYGFVRQCGGDLRITSEVGRGSTIELLLPCVEAPVQSELLSGARIGDPPPAAAATPATRTLLVIDDDDGVRTVLVEALRAAGYTVADASDGITGLDLLKRLAPAAAIIDFIMPGMNGAEVARRARVQMPEIPVIFVSGYFDTVALDGISGAIIVRKPIDLDGLQRTVSSVLH